MSRFIGWFGGSLVFAAALTLGLAPLSAQQPGQPSLPFYPGTPTAAPAGSNQPPAQTQGMARLSAPSNNALVPVQNPAYYNNVVVAPAGGYYPGNSPYGGYLTGKANLVEASGQLMLNVQQAGLLQQQVVQSQVDTRNKILQQRLYEASITPNTEDLRNQEMLTKLRHSRNNPPPADVWSGDALNSLAQAILSAQRVGIMGPTVPLPEDALKHLNLNVPGKVNSSLGLLRDGGKLDWPQILQDDAFKKDRDRIDELSPRAVVQASTGKVEVKVLKELQALVERMTADLRRMVQDAAPDQYMEGKRYLTDLGKSIKVLQDPAVGNYFGKWAPRGKNVAELVQHLSDNGLEFAPATPGDESYYQALYGSLLAYDTGISQLVARQTPQR